MPNTHKKTTTTRRWCLTRWKVKRWVHNDAACHLQHVSQYTQHVLNLFRAFVIWVQMHRNLNNDQSNSSLETSAAESKMSYLQARAISHAERVRRLYKEAIRQLQAQYGFQRSKSLSFIGNFVQFDLWSQVAEKRVSAVSSEDFAYLSYSSRLLNSIYSIHFVNRLQVCHSLVLDHDYNICVINLYVSLWAFWFSFSRNWLLQFGLQLLSVLMLAAFYTCFSTLRCNSLYPDLWHLCFGAVQWMFDGPILAQKLWNESA